MIKPLSFLVERGRRTPLKIYVLLLGKLWEVRELSLHLLLLTCLQLKIILMPPWPSVKSGMADRSLLDHSKCTVSNTPNPRSYIPVKLHFSPLLPSTYEVIALNSDTKKKKIIQLNFIVLDLASCSCLFDSSLSFDSVTHHSNYYCTLPPTSKVVPSKRAGDVEITQVGYFLVKRFHVPMCLRFIPFHSDFLSLITLFIYLLDFLGAGFEIEPL